MTTRNARKPRALIHRARQLWQQLNAINASLGPKIDGVDLKLTMLDNKVKVVDQKVDRVSARVDEQDDKIAKLEETVQSMQRGKVATDSAAAFVPKGKRKTIVI